MRLGHLGIFAMYESTVYGSLDKLSLNGLHLDDIIDGIRVDVKVYMGWVGLSWKNLLDQFFFSELVKLATRSTQIESATQLAFKSCLHSHITPILISQILLSKLYFEIFLPLFSKTFFLNRGQRLEHTSFGRRRHKNE